MRKLIYVGTLLSLLVAAGPSYAFLDYLFGGSSSRDAIDNSAVGDMRAWWTGNPSYQFNPWGGGQPPQQQQQQQQTGAQPPQPTVNFSGQQQVPPSSPGGVYPQQMAPTPPGVVYPQGGVPGQPMAQQYQSAPQQFQNPQGFAQQGAGYPPQAYQPQPYQMPMQQGYPAGVQGQ
jgi:hypothetical protein